MGINGNNCRISGIIIIKKIYIYNFSEMSHFITFFTNFMVLGGS